MELPPVGQNSIFINLPANQDIAALLSKLQPGSAIEAQVKAIISDGLYLISFLDSFIEVETDQALQPGQMLALKVKSKSPVLTLEISGTQSAPAIKTPVQTAPEKITDGPRDVLAKLSMPATKENLQAAEFALKHNLPLTKDTIEFASKNLTPESESAKIDSAAYMLSKSLPHSVRLLDALTKAVTNPLSLGQTITALKNELQQLVPGNPALQPLLDEINALQGFYTLDESPSIEALKQAIISSGQPRFAGVISGFEAIVAETLQTDPILKIIDALMQKMDSTLPAKTAVSVDLNRLYEIITKSPHSPQVVQQLTDAMENMDAKTLAQFKSQLMEMERNTIAKMPQLADLNRIAPLMRDLADAVMALKTLNLTSQSFADNTFYVQIPVTADGMTTTLLLKIHQRQKGKGKYADRHYTGITINVELSQTGLVTAFIELFSPVSKKEKKKANISFKVPDQKTKRAFEENSTELVNELDAFGYQANVNVKLRGPAEKPVDLSEYLRANGTIDITI